MKPISLSSVFTLVITFFFSAISQAQTFGVNSSAIWVTDCNQSNYYNTTGSGASLIAPAGNAFHNNQFGVHTRNSGTLILRGAQVRTFKAVTGNVCSARLFYRVYQVSATPGSYTSIDLPLLDDCNIITGEFPSGGSCAAGDQKWNRVIPDGSNSPAPVNLTNYAPGNYVLEAYYEVTGSSASPVLCNETVTENNSGTSFRAFFSIQEPDVSSTNPTTCNGSQGSITITDLTPGVSYTVNYSDDGMMMGPIVLVANASGQITITGLNAGIYSDFELIANGCSTFLNTGVILSNPVYTPTFTPIAPFCAGTTPPVLPSVSNNGISGTWSPAVINNMASGTYTFTPTPGQCGIPAIRNIVVIPNTTPAFSFGTSLSICAGGIVPILPNTSNNGITGTWSPATVDNNNSGTYTFTPTAGICASPATFTVTVTPNITPVFDFGNALSICANAGVPALPATSTNGITGTWSPASISNTASGSYTFTPSAGQCALPFTLNVTVTPNTTPVFSFGTTLSICSGASVPSLPSSSDNGINGSWSPATVSNTASGTYTFTPAAGVCALPVNFTVTVNPNITPTFVFGTSISICANATVPALPNTSTNGITGTWNQASIDNQNSGTYTFTPAAGQCALPASLSVTITPNVTPLFTFGNALAICSGASVPALPSASTNGINGSWNPATVSNTASGTYTFTPAAGVCALPADFTVTVTPNTTPVFDFGTSLVICSGASVPALPPSSNNGVSGSWSPATVSNTASGTYTFTPASGQCALPASFSVTVNNNITPTFAFGTSLTICEGAAVPALPATSSNGITGTWSPTTVDNQASATYTFTPTAGLCALPASFTVTVNPNVTPAFAFGTTLAICSGATAPALPSTSSNGIAGTWSPATISNTSSGSYTFTPAAGICALPTTLTVTVNSNTTPAFAFGTSLTACEGSSMPSLPSLSDNGITGTWSPATVSNTNSGTYTFTPAAGQCATTATFTVTITPNVTPAFTFGTSLTICEGGAVPALPNTSTNGIAGTWSPATVDNNNSGTYTFNPAAGVCALPASFTVTVNPNVTPAFAFGTTLAICSGATAPALPATSTNGITGTWSPATISNTSSGSYTFTPAAGICALPTTLTVTVNSNTTPAFAFGTSLTACEGSSMPSLPSLSDNGITGTWSPATVSNANSGTYTFTPAAGQCATTATFTVTITPNVTPAFTFGTSLTICEGGAVPALPATSSNGINGTWSPATVDNNNSGTYTFTPAAGVCALPVNFIVTVNPNVTPSFSFGNALNLCAGSTAPALPATSTNGITGTWSPASIDNQNSGTYTFTPTAGLCALPVSLNVTVQPTVLPVFSIGTSLTICEGAAVPLLPGVSDNGIAGSWNPAVVSNTASGVYTFTPSGNACYLPVSFTVTVNPNIVPAFSFGTSLGICEGGIVPAIPNTSTNGISGTWSPAVVDNNTSGTYTFTPAAGSCATSTTFTVTVNPNTVPVFDFGTSLSICAGASVPALPTASTNGVNGTWSPATVSNQASGVYTFTPVTNVCASPVTFNVTVTPNTIPVFDFGTSLTICSGGIVPALPTTSTNGFTGTWSPATVSNTASAVYTFTPDPVPGQCIGIAAFTVTVNPILAPTFSFGNSLSLCAGSTTPVLPAISDNGISGSWSPAVISNQASGVYTFTSAPGQCATAGTTLNVTIIPVATVFSGNKDTVVNDGAILPGNNLSGTPAGVSFTWTNSNPAIGLPASGTGNIPSFTAVNNGSAPVIAVITITPVLNGCAGAPYVYRITVNALDKDVFVPNVFSPNNDGKNDLLKVYGNYISRIDMRIFNQWGEQVQRITDKNAGWDGRHQGKPQPVGVYVYTLQVVMLDGKTLNLKGNITLLR